METPYQTRHEEALQRHHRQTRRQIILPGALGLVALGVGLIVVVVISTPTEISITADLLLTILVLCPLALCAFPLAIGFFVLAVLMNAVHDWTDLKLASVMRFSADLNDRIDRLMDRLARAGITIGVKAAPLEKFVFSVFDRREETVVLEASHEPIPTRRDDDTGLPAAGTRTVED